MSSAFLANCPKIMIIMLIAPSEDRSPQLKWELKEKERAAANRKRNYCLMWSNLAVPDIWETG
jgi:hypothetical protein